jgi:hypothetical protein
LAIPRPGRAGWASRSAAPQYVVFAATGLIAVCLIWRRRMAARAEAVTPAR